MKHCIRPIFAMLAMLGCCSAFAAVSAEEAKQLGAALTPWGAEKAGNKEGTIPAYTGGLTTPPASYHPAKRPIFTDPYANEKPLFSIDSKNMAQYGDKLADSLKAMMTKYPGFRIDVYPSHRTTHYPQRILDYSVANATKCKLVGAKIENCSPGVPFPIPKSAEEVLWNKYLSFQGEAFENRNDYYVVDAGGTATNTGSVILWTDVPYYKLDRKEDPKIFLRWRADTEGPARNAGEKIMLFYPLDLSITPSVWQYLPGQRRVKLSPDLAYDTPNPSSAGSSTMDEVQGYWGQMDRYNWKLVGKKEMFIPYNNYKLFETQAECGRDKLLTKNYSNPACVRFELQRVWVVEGTLKEGKRHIYSRRMMYIDEDSYGAGIFDGYAATGKIYRTTWRFPMANYTDNSLGMYSIPYTTFDLQTGIYGAFNTANGASTNYAAIVSKLPEREFTPEALAGGGVR